MTIKKYFRRSFSLDNSSRLARRAALAKCCRSTAALRKHDASENACHRPVTRRSTYSIRYIICEIPIPLIAFGLCCYAPHVYIRIAYSSMYYFACGTVMINTFQLEEGEIDVRLNSFKGCFMQRNGRPRK